MLALLTLLLVGTTAIEYRAPRDRQFQIQGVEVVDDERPLGRLKRQFNGGFAPQQQYILPQQIQQYPGRQRVFHDLPGYPSEPVARPQTVVKPSKQHRVQQQQPHVDFNGARYYYPPRQPFPLPKCFHNPTGYVCCNQHLNDLIVETYTELDQRPKFHTCNVNALATHLQVRAEKRFNVTFETIAAYDDFAQMIHFKDDYVCKVEMGGKFMLAYATVKDVNNRFLRPPVGHEGPANFVRSNRQTNSMFL